MKTGPLSFDRIKAADLRRRERAEIGGSIGVTEARGKLCGIVDRARHEGVSTPISHRGEIVAYVVPRGLIESLARRLGLPAEDLLGDDCGRLVEGGQP